MTGRCGGWLMCWGAIALCCLACAQTQDSDRILALEKQLKSQQRLLRDWGGLIVYGSDDSTIRPPAAGEKRVVFLGDQVTEAWGRGGGGFFPGKPYFNRGIGRQTTAQMLVRFRQDVISLRPKVVILQGGVNDLAGLGGPSTEEMVAENFMSMSELAQAHGIRVAIASLTPVSEISTKLVGKRSQEILQRKIVELNEALKDYAGRNHIVFLDYYSALVNGRGLRPEFTNDGLLPNDAGYGIMAPLAEKAIAAALGGKKGIPKELQ